MDCLNEALADSIILVMIAVCILAGMILKAVTVIVKTHAVERSRREIAAYIAEGSMTPEQGERLLRAGASRDESA